MLHVVLRHWRSILKYNTGGRGNTPIMNDRKMGKIGTMSQSNPVTAHGTFNTIDVPCYLIGISTKVPNENFAYYATKHRDDVVRELFDEILKRSDVVLCSNLLTKKWLVEFFSIPDEKVDYFVPESEGEIKRALDKFWRAQSGIIVPIEPKDVYFFYNRQWGRTQNSLFYDEYDKNVIVKGPQISYQDETVIYSAEISINGKDEILWVSTPRKNEKYFVTDRCDAFLIAVLPFAMRYNHDILISGSVSSDLLHNIKEILIPSLVRNDKSLYSIQILCEEDNSIIIGEGVGTAISGGVDSFWTLTNYIDNEVSSYRLTNLYVGNYLYEGEAKKLIYERANAISKELGIPLIKSDTNVSKMFDKYIPHLFYHAYKTFFGIFALRKAWNKYYYSSGYEFESFSLKDNSKSDTAHYDLLLAHVFSVNGFSVYSAGASVDRYEKTKFISKNPITYKYLNVCLDPSRKINCGRCGKCTRTLLNLEMCGAVDEYSEVFDLNYFINNKRKALEQMVREKNSPFYRKAYQYYKKQNRELIEEIEGKI